jgi:hypothetical protein
MAEGERGEADVVERCLCCSCKTRRVLLKKEVWKGRG